jgi:hypothetical protein
MGPPPRARKGVAPRPPAHPRGRIPPPPADGGGADREIAAALRAY